MHSAGLPLPHACVYTHTVGHLFCAHKCTHAQLHTQAVTIVRSPFPCKQMATHDTVTHALTTRSHMHTRHGHTCTHNTVTHAHTTRSHMHTHKSTHTHTQHGHTCTHNTVTHAHTTRSYMHTQHGHTCTHNTVTQAVTTARPLILSMQTHTHTHTSTHTQMHTHRL
jgi:hypothetical protein